MPFIFGDFGDENQKAAIPTAKQANSTTAAELRHICNFAATSTVKLA